MTSAKKIKNVSDMDIFDEYDAIMTGKNSPQCLSKSEKQKIIKEFTTMFIKVRETKNYKRSEETWNR